MAKAEGRGKGKSRGQKQRAEAKSRRRRAVESALWPLPSTLALCPLPLPFAFALCPFSILPVVERPRLRQRVLAVFADGQGRGRVHGELVEAGAELDGVVEGLVPGDDLAGVAG